MNAAVAVVMETPKSRPDKLTFDRLRQRFRLSRVLPAGMAFSFIL